MAREILEEVEQFACVKVKTLSRAPLSGASFKRGPNSLSDIPTIVLIITDFIRSPGPHFGIESSWPIYKINALFEISETPRDIWPFFRYTGRNLPIANVTLKVYHITSKNIALERELYMMDPPILLEARKRHLRFKGWNSVNFRRYVGNGLAPFRLQTARRWGRNGWKWPS